MSDSNETGDIGPTTETKVISDSRYKNLQALRRYAAATPTRLDRPKSLRIKDIAIAATVFQPRSYQTSHYQVAELHRALKAKRGTTKQFLEPLIVWPCGDYFFLIDGHQRYEAYRSAGIKQPVPVRCFPGDLEEAIEYGISANSKDKLPMTKREKLNAAWRLTVIGHFGTRKFSISQIAEATGRGTNTISMMRKALKTLLNAPQETEGMVGGTEIPPVSIEEKLTDMSWDQARDAAAGEGKSYGAEELDKLIAEYRDKIQKAVGNKLADQPHIAARVFEAYAPTFPDRLVDAFHELGIVSDGPTYREDDEYAEELEQPNEIGAQEDRPEREF